MLGDYALSSLHTIRCHSESAAVYQNGLVGKRFP